jgi:hypothetical protein
MAKPTKELKPLLDRAERLGCRIEMVNGRRSVLRIYPSNPTLGLLQLVQGQAAVRPLERWLNRIERLAA